MRLRATLVALALAVATTAAQAETLTPAEMRQAGFVALTNREPGKALAIAEALVARDGTDTPALILRSRALRDLGRYPEALRAARVAWKAAETDEARYGAALAMAQAQSSSGNKTLAQFWLRRAVQAAPTPLSREIAERDFDYVRSRNPWIVSVDVSAAPSSNVNGGSTSDTLGHFFGYPLPVPPDAQPLSGFQASTRLDLRYRLPPGSQSQNELRFKLDNRVTWLSSSAKDKAPMARGSDYNFHAVELGWGGKARLDDSRRLWSYGVMAGRNWYGGAPLTNYLHVDFGVDQPISPRLLVAGQIYAERQQRLDTDLRSANVVGVTGTLVQALKNGDRMRLTLGAENNNSESFAVQHYELRASVGWDKGRPVKGMKFSAEVGYQFSDYPDYIDTLSFPNEKKPREDHAWWAEASVTFDRIQYYGFSPVVSVSATRTESNIGLFESENYGLSLGFRSAF